MCKRSFIYIRQQIQFVIFQKGYRMGDTKEKILMTALQLFARDGYEAVSVRNIAEELDITKGALYRHYKNKRDI